MSTSWLSIIGFFLAEGFVLLAIVWWCARQYHRARKKGYRPLPAYTVIVGTIVAINMIGLIVADALLSDSTWSDDGESTVGLLVSVPVGVLVVTALVALLPRRRPAGPQPSVFLSSPAYRLLEVGLVVAAVAAGVCGIVRLWLFPAEWLKLSLFVFAAWAALMVRPWLRFARARFDAPTLSDTVTADTRPAVLYLRAFQHELDPFVWGPDKELARYTQRSTSALTIQVTFEQYLGPEFARQVGPFIALGNPLDPLPPEGAARSYATDENWQQHFSTLAATAAAIVMHSSRSSNLYWELAEITRNGWPTKLFFFTPPASCARTSIAAPVGRRMYTVLQWAIGVRVPRWEEFTAELRRVGLHLPPAEPCPGSVLAFDSAGHAEIVVRGAQQPEEFVAAVRARLVS